MAEEQQFQIEIDKTLFGGVWSNVARVSHSPYEFTIDFARVDYAQQPPRGVVVSRVNMSPLMVTQLIDALRTNWHSYERKALPPEVYRDADPDNGPAVGDAPNR